MSVVLLSALYGNYEAVKRQPDLGVPMVMYTDDPNLEAPGWEVRHEPLTNVSSAMMRSRYWKCRPDLAVPEAKASIWIDASMTVLRPDFVPEMVRQLGDADLLLVDHPWRDCIYQEVPAAAAAPKYASQPMEAQVAEYRSAGHPPNWGLVACNMLVRRHSDRTRALGDAWWHEQQRWTYMDQLALPPLLRTMDASWNWVSDPWEHWWSIGSHPSVAV